MPLLRITAHQTRPQCHDGDMPLDALLAHAHAAAAPGPVVIMLHGYKYAPGQPGRCPHDTVQGLTPAVGRKRGISWPKHLGHGPDAQARGLAISFGWMARGSVWRAWRNAEMAGAALAHLLSALRRYAPGRPVHLFAHSMGARVALAALRRANPGDVASAILMAPAEFAGAAQAALDAPGGRAVQVLHVASAENAFFDALVQTLIRPPRRGDRPMGRAGADCGPVATLRLDDPRALDLLRRMGFAIAPPDRRVCHWSSYMRPGLFPLYRAILAQQVTIAELRALLPGPAPRRSPSPRSLFFARKTSHWGA